MLGVGVTYSLPLTNQTYETVHTISSSTSSSSSLSQTSILLEEEKELEAYELEEYEFATKPCSFTVIGSDLVDTLTGITSCREEYNNCIEEHKFSYEQESESSRCKTETAKLTNNSTNSESNNQGLYNNKNISESNIEEHLQYTSYVASNMSEHSQNDERREHRHERRRQRRAREHRRNSSSSSSSSHSRTGSDTSMTENREWEECDSNISDGDDNDDDDKSNMYTENDSEKTYNCNHESKVASLDSKENEYVNSKSDPDETKHVLLKNNINHQSLFTCAEMKEGEQIKERCHTHSHHRSQLSATAHISYLPSHHASNYTEEVTKPEATPLENGKDVNNSNNNVFTESIHGYTVAEYDTYNSRAPSCTPPPQSQQITGLESSHSCAIQHANNKIISSSINNNNNNNNNSMQNRHNNYSIEDNTFTRMYTVGEHKREGENNENLHKLQSQQERQQGSWEEETKMEEEEEEEEEEQELEHQHSMESKENGKKETVSNQETMVPEKINRKVVNHVYEESDEEVQEPFQEEEEEEEQESHGQEQHYDCTEAVHTPPYIPHINKNNNYIKNKQAVPSLQLEMLEEPPLPPVRETKYNKVIPLTDSHFAGVAITRFMTRMCKANVSEPVPSSDFHSHRLPPMSVKNYMERIVRHCNCSGEALLCGLVLLLKYSFYSNHPINIYNAHRLLLTSTVLGIKMRDEVYYSNVYYARIGGIAPKEMNKLEVLFLSKLGWDVSVEAKHYGELLELLTVFVDTPTDEVLEPFANTHFIRQVPSVFHGTKQGESSKECQEDNVAQDEPSCKLCTECINRLQSHVAELATNTAASPSLHTVLAIAEDSANTNSRNTTNSTSLEETQECKEQKRREQLELELEEYNSDDYDGFVQNVKAATSSSTSGTTAAVRTGGVVTAATTIGTAAHSSAYHNKLNVSSYSTNNNSDYRQRVRKWNERANISLAQLIKCFRCHKWHEEVIPWLSRFQEETFAYHEEKAHRERADWAAEEEKWEKYRAAEYAAALEASTRSSVSLSRWTSPQSLHKSTQLSHISSVNQTAHPPLTYVEFQQQQQQQFFYAAHGHELYPSVNHFGGGNSSINAYCLNGNRPISYHTHLINGQTLTYEASPTSLSASSSYHSYLLQHQQQNQNQNPNQNQKESSVGWSYMNHLSDGMLVNAQGVSYSSAHVDPNYFANNNTTSLTSTNTSNNNNNNNATQHLFGTLGVSEEHYQAQIADQYDRFKNADGRASPMTINGSMSTARYTNFRYNQRISTPTSNNYNNNTTTTTNTTNSKVTSSELATNSNNNTSVHTNSHGSNHTNRKQTQHYFTGTAWRHGNQRVAVPTGLRSPYAQGKVYSQYDYNTHTTTTSSSSNNNTTRNNESTGFLTRAMDKESHSAQATTHLSSSSQGLPPRPAYPIRAVTPGTGINVHAEPYYFSKKSSKVTSAESKNGTNQLEVPVRCDASNQEVSKNVGHALSSSINMNVTCTSEDQTVDNKNVSSATDHRMSEHREEQHDSHEFPAIPVYTTSIEDNHNNSNSNTSQAQTQEVQQTLTHSSHSTTAHADTRERSNDSSANGETTSKVDVRIGKKRPKPAHYQDYYE